MVVVGSGAVVSGRMDAGSGTVVVSSVVVVVTAAVLFFRCLMGRKLGATMLGSDSVHNDLLNRVQIINTSNLKIRPLEAEIFSNYVTSMTLQN